jgi:hypothetical protein
MRKKIKKEKKKNYLVASSAALMVSSTGAPLAARLAMIPSLVVGT